MAQTKDILEEIPVEDIIKLCDLYKNHFPSTVYVYNLLSAAARWKMQRPDKDYITVMSPHGFWQNGTVFVIQKYNSYEVFLCTLETTYEILYEVITTTKKIDWSKRMFVYAVHEKHHATVRRALEKTSFAFLQDIPCRMWWLPVEKGLKLTYDCPDDVYLAKLKPEHALILGEKWPHGFKGCEKYMEVLIEMNGGYGIFLKSSDAIVAWILRIQFGVGMVHVEEDHKRNGYGSLVVKALTKEMAQEGIAPGATVLVKNPAALAMFEKIGFEQLDQVVFIESKSE